MDISEVRVLSGPSAEFAVPAIRISFGVPQAGTEVVGSQIEALIADLADRAGIARPVVSVRFRQAGEPVVAFTWERRGTGQALADEVARIIAAGSPATDAELAAAAARVATADPGPSPDLIDPKVPATAITGTNGKTTTTRLLAHMATAAGRRPGWSSTEGVFVAGELVAEGDWSGPAGAREVLEHDDVDFAILETARGGLMQRGMSVSAVDVAVITNISTDHLGLQGLDTVADLAWAKAAVCRVVRPSGWVVLNAEDSLVRPFHNHAPVRPWFFAIDPAGEGAQYAASMNAPLTTVVAGRITVLGVEPVIEVIPVPDVPVTIAGLSSENLANALAATSAGLAIGLPLAAVRAGLAEFRPDPKAGSGRMNVWSAPLPSGASCTVILDFAHNEAGAVALLRVAQGLRQPGAMVHASIGNAGDRTDEGIREVGRIAAGAADSVQLAAKSRFLRGRTQKQMDQLQIEGIRQAGGEVAEIMPDEPSGLAAMLDRAQSGDVIAMMVHQDLKACMALLADRGATPDSPEEISRKAAASRQGRGDEISAATRG